MKKLLLAILLNLISTLANSQEKEYTRSAIKTGFGGAINDSHIEQGVGLLYNIGFQTQLGKNDRFRVSPTILYGGFTSVASDVRDQFYRISALNMDFHGDIIRLNPLSLTLTLGGFVNYSRGLLGTGGDPDFVINRNSSYFNKFYFGTKLGLAFRFVNASGSRAFEFKPISIMKGNNDFTLGYLMFGMDFYLRK